MATMKPAYILWTRLSSVLLDGRAALWSGCNRCGGEGQIPRFGHVAKGVCFKCWGVGGQTRYFRFGKRGGVKTFRVNSEARGGPER